MKRKKREIWGQAIRETFGNDFEQFKSRALNVGGVTRNELQILRLLFFPSDDKSYTYKEVGALLGKSPQYAHACVHRALFKLGIASKTEATPYLRVKTHSLHKLGVGSGNRHLSESQPTGPTSNCKPES